MSKYILGLVLNTLCLSLIPMGINHSFTPDPQCLVDSTLEHTTLCPISFSLSIPETFPKLEPLFPELEYIVQPKSYTPCQRTQQTPKTVAQPPPLQATSSIIAAFSLSSSSSRKPNSPVINISTDGSSLAPQMASSITKQKTEQETTKRDCKRKKAQISDTTKKLKVCRNLSPAKPFKCMIEKCKKSFSKKASLVRHSLIHTGLKPHACPYCDHTSAEKGNLKRHVEALHLQLKPYHCTECSKRFMRKEHLEYHQFNHRNGLGNTK